MPVNRRHFFGTALSAALLPLPALVVERDDSAWLQAMLNAGRPIPAGTYYLRGTLRMPPGSHIMDSVFIGKNANFHIEGGHDVSFHDNLVVNMPPYSTTFPSWS
jgi:hypothetical protein